MTVYRAYCLDGAGKVMSAEWIEADDDAAALTSVRNLGRSMPVELWQGQRRVCLVSPDERSGG